MAVNSYICFTLHEVTYSFQFQGKHIVVEEPVQFLIGVIDT